MAKVVIVESKGNHNQILLSAMLTESVLCCVHHCGLLQVELWAVEEEGLSCRDGRLSRPLEQ